MFGFFKKWRRLRETDDLSLRGAFAHAAIAHIGIDMQDFYCNPKHGENRTHPQDFKEEARVTRRVSAFAAKTHGIPLRHVWVTHVDPVIRFADGCRFYGIAPAANDDIVEKPCRSAFENTDLDKLLRRRGVTTLCLSGLFLEQCVARTAEDGIDRGYNVVVMNDLCVPGCLAEDIEQAEQEIESRGARLLASKDLLRIAAEARP